MRNYAILNIVVEDAKIFQTKERAPLLLCFETYRPLEILTEQPKEIYEQEEVMELIQKESFNKGKRQPRKSKSQKKDLEGKPKEKIEYKLWSPDSTTKRLRPTEGAGRSHSFTSESRSLVQPFGSALSREASNTLMTKKTSKFAFLNKFNKKNTTKNVDVEIVAPEDINMSPDNMSNEDEQFKTLVEDLDAKASDPIHVNNIVASPKKDLVVINDSHNTNQIEITDQMVLPHQDKEKSMKSY